MSGSLVHRALARSWLARLGATAVLALLLGGCETTGFDLAGGRTGEARAERLAANGQHADAAGVYIGLATEASGGERDRLTLLAVEQWLDAGDADRAGNAFAGVPLPAEPDLRRLWSTNSAALLLYAGEPDAALDVLEPMSRESLSLRHRIRVEALRADAWIQKRDPTRAVELMTRRETLLRDAGEIEQNRWRLWQALTVSDPQVLRSAAELALDGNVRGWLTLASLATSTGQQGIGWANGVRRWRDAYSEHPATLVLDRLEIPTDLALDYPRHIALLLPLTGRAAAAGRALQNGFMGAYFSALPGLEDPQTIRVYDVNSEGGAGAAYDTAVSDGAEFVIGPLLRENVAALANDILVPVPVLTLNYLPDDTLAPPGLFQFALAPEDEARDAASRAIADGYRRGVALVPNNEWGRRLLTSFSTEFENLGGTLLDYRSYTPTNPDYSITIEDLMALSGSVQRYQRLRANIGGPLQFDPRRRQDSEFVFLAADAPAGRLLKSQLRFHYSGDLPVYSTSSIYAMDGRSNSDLDGIMFADTPWIVDPQHAGIKELPSVYQEYWPAERRLARLHAMGYDAYQLIAILHSSRGGFVPEIQGATGKLYLDEEGRVRRRLAWAQFRGGEPEAMPQIAASGATIQDFETVPEIATPDAGDEAMWYEADRSQ